MLLVACGQAFLISSIISALSVGGQRNCRGCRRSRPRPSSCLGRPGFFNQVLGLAGLVAALDFAFAAMTSELAN